MEIVITLIILALFVIFIIKSLSIEIKSEILDKNATLILFEKYRPIIQITEEVEALAKLYMEFFNKITKIGDFGKRRYIINKDFQEEAIDLLGIMRERLIQLTPANTKKNE